MNTRTVDKEITTKTADELLTEIAALVINKPWQVTITHKPDSYARAIYQDVGSYWFAAVSNYAGEEICSAPRMQTHIGALGVSCGRIKERSFSYGSR